MKKIFILFALSLTLFAQSVAQNRANKIQDARLFVKAWDGNVFCLGPKIVGDRTLLAMLPCKDVRTSRYDLYKRLAFRFNDNWLCASLSDDMKKNKKTSDYVELKPCILNDDSQWFNIKDEFSLSAYPKTKITEKNFLVVATNNNFGNKLNIFKEVMKEWLEATPPPVNYALKTPIYFLNQTGNKVDRFYLNKNGASKTPFNFYYDTFTGKIAVYNPKSASFECLESNLNNKDFTFIGFKKCNFEDRESKFAWNFNLFENSFILDSKNNLLDVARGGDFGKLFIVTKKYYKENLAASKQSNGQFFFDSSVYQLRNYNAKNFTFSASKCGNERIFKRDIRSDALANFNPLLANWKDRLRRITRSTDSSGDFSGLCGICMLQTYEIISLLTHAYVENPDLESSNIGLLFDYADHTSPFISFQRHNPAPYNLMQEALELWGGELVFGESLYSRGVRAMWALTRGVLPWLEWSLSSISEEGEIDNQLRRLFSAPLGSLFIGLLNLENGRAHAVPIIVTNAGIVVIPTNAEDITEEEFSSLITPSTSLFTLRASLNAHARYNITGLTLIGLVGSRENELGGVLNQYDCTGDGNHRRGNGNFLNPNNANACGFGRCDLMEVDFTFSS